MVSYRDNSARKPLKSADYTIWLINRLSKTNQIITLRELISGYEIETGKKLSHDTYEKWFKKIGKGHVKRKEQLYWYPIEIIPLQAQWLGSIPQQQPLKTHSSHNYRFSIGYQGKQPKNKDSKPWGRTKAQFQTEYRFKGNLKLQIFKNRIIVMLANPIGITTQEQVISARSEAYLTIVSFIKENNLKLNKEELKAGLSHHVLEVGNAKKERTSNNLNRYIKDYIGEDKDTFYDITGSHFDNSHPGKLEHDKLSQYYTSTPEQRAKNTEWLLAQFRSDFATLCNKQIKYSESIALYDEQIRAHLSAIQELRDYIRELRDIKRDEKPCKK